MDPEGGQGALHPSGKSQVAIGFLKILVRAPP